MLPTTIARDKIAAKIGGLIVRNLELASEISSRPVSTVQLIGGRETFVAAIAVKVHIPVMASALDKGAAVDWLPSHL